MGSTTAEFTLDFSASDDWCLLRTHFVWEAHRLDVRAVRGKTAGAFRGHGTFQWTRGVRATVMLLVRHKLSAPSGVSAVIGGGKGSLASSLDYSISKETTWLMEMFGLTLSGALVACRLFTRTNSSRRSNGPVFASVNGAILPPQSVHILREGTPVSDVASLVELLRILGIGLDSVAPSELAARGEVADTEYSVASLANASTANEGAISAAD